jgi:uncharacterized protein YegP (UPF0339 family)
VVTARAAATQRPYRIVVLPAKSNPAKVATGPHFWRMLAPNGATVCHSQVYANKANAHRGADSVASAHVQVQEVA